MADPDTVTDELVECRYRYYTLPGAEQALAKLVAEQPGEGNRTHMLCEDDLAAIGHETLIVWTDHNPTTPAEVGRRAARLMPPGVRPGVGPPFPPRPGRARRVAEVRRLRHGGDHPRTRRADRPCGTPPGGRRQGPPRIPIHTEIMAVRDDVGAVVHSHAESVVAFATALAGHNAVLLHRHGLVTAGPDVPTAVLTAIFLLRRLCAAGFDGTVLVKKSTVPIDCRR